MIFFLEVFVQLRRLSTAFKNCLLFNFVVALVDFSFPRQSLSFWRSWELSKSKAIHGDQDWYVCDRKIVDKTYNSLRNFEVKPQLFQSEYEIRQERMELWPLIFPVLYYDCVLVFNISFWYGQYYKIYGIEMQKFLLALLRVENFAEFHFWCR